MTSVKEALAWGSAAFSSLDRPWHEARVLLRYILNVTPEYLVGYPETELSNVQWEGFQAWVHRRCAGEPTAKIIGQKEFWKDTFFTSQDTLDPRPESETFLDALGKLLPNKNHAYTFLELGIGTGCLLFSLLKEYPASRGMGVDRSQAALAVAQKNRARLSVDERALLVCGDWTQSIIGTFDVILSNPPYIPSAEIPMLTREVGFDPVLALDGGTSGLEVYAHFSSCLQVFLKSQGLLLLEVGATQSLDVKRLFAEQGWPSGKSYYDLLGHERILVWQK